MARIKMFARRTLILAGFAGLMGAASLGTWAGIAAAFSLGHYAVADR